LFHLCRHEHRNCRINISITSVSDAPAYVPTQSMGTRVIDKALKIVILRRPTSYEESLLHAGTVSLISTPSQI
jgi:hypothetical protein